MAKKKKMPGKTIKWREQGRFEIQFSKETDRAAGVLAGCFLEAVLEQVIREQLQPAEGERTERVFGRTLFSLASKIDMAFALGLADERMCIDMENINKIRNHFAHSIEDASFDESSVKNLCSKLEIVGKTLGAIPGEKMGSRELYLLAVTQLSGLLRNALD